MDAKTQIIKSIELAVSEMAGESLEINLDIPSDTQHGDYSSNAALQLSKKMGKSPQEIANGLKSKIESWNLEVLEKIEVAGPGFLNFYLSPEYLSKNLNVILEKKETYGTSDINSGKKVIVEFSSPNIAKPFTVGHLRSTIIGNSLSNILETSGWQVYKDNHLGDWGTQFGKQIYAIKEWGNEEEVEKSANPVKDLVALYVKFHEEAEKNPELEEKARVWFKKLEDGDSEARRLWQKCIDWSFREFDKLYKELGVTFTENNGRGFGESYFEDKMQGPISELKEKNLLKEDQGAQLVYFQDDKYPPLMIIKQDGATLYSTRDLATDKFRLDTYGSEVKIINEVGIEQSLYFQQLYELEKLLGWVKEGQRVHMRHGHYRFKDAKMSTRKGNTIWLEDVLKEAVEKAKSIGKDKESVGVAKDIGIGALKWNDLKRNPVQEIVFDWADILNMEGNSGPYMQYAYARTQSILSKSKIVNSEFRILNCELEEKELLSKLQHYPEIILTASETLSTSLICNYLYELAKNFNLFYEKHRILPSVIASEAKQSQEVTDFRLQLTAAVGQVLKNGLTLLGITTPSKI